MINSIIVQYIEKILDKFKTKNGLVYGIIMLTLISVYALGKYLISGNNISGINIPPQYISYINYILVIIAALTGAHTPQKNVQDSETKN